MLLTPSKKQHAYGQVRSIACKYSQLLGNYARPKKYTKIIIKPKHGIFNIKGIIKVLYGCIELPDVHGRVHKIMTQTVTCMYVPR